MDLLATLISGGVVVAILGTMVTLVRIAVGTERRRADDWREVAQTSKAAADVMSEHVDKLTSTLEILTVAQREMMTLLQSAGSERREMMTLLQAMSGRDAA